jgi:hypothetical protein
MRYDSNHMKIILFQIFNKELVNTCIATPVDLHGISGICDGY